MNSIKHQDTKITHKFLLRSFTRTMKSLKRKLREQLFQQMVLGKVDLFCSVMSSSLSPHGLQHTRLPCPSPSPGACSNSCPLSPSIHLILWCPLLLLPSIFSSIRVFFNQLALRIRWPEYWSFSFSISSSSEYSQLISIRIDWFDLLAVQGTLKSLHAKEWNGIFT